MPVVAHNAYTNEPGEGPFVIFPTHAHQILSICIHIIGQSPFGYFYRLNFYLQASMQACPSSPFVLRGGRKVNSLEHGNGGQA